SGEATKKLRRPTSCLAMPARRHPALPPRGDGMPRVTPRLQHPTATEKVRSPRPSPLLLIRRRGREEWQEEERVHQKKRKQNPLKSSDRFIPRHCSGGIAFLSFREYELVSVCISWFPLAFFCWGFRWVSRIFPLWLSWNRGLDRGVTVSSWISGGKDWFLIGVSSFLNRLLPNPLSAL
ncbi:hypothetical protein B296_00033597, partial [Ensete ventricosum]